MDTFYAGTKTEIENCTNGWIKRFHLKYLLAHHGEFNILKDGIFLGDWRIIYWDIIQKVTLENDEILSAKMFATQARLYFLKSAKPIKLILIDGDVIYLYVNWSFGTGLSANIQVYENIKRNIK